MSQTARPHEGIQGDKTHMKVDSVEADGAEMVACSWEDMWGRTQRQMFQVDELKCVPDPDRQMRRRRRGPSYC